MRTIEVTTDKKVIVVSGIPDDSKITYGGIRPDQPGTKTNTLRIYAGGRAGSSQNQLAVIRDVVEFHDLTLTIEDKGEPPKEWM